MKPGGSCSRSCSCFSPRHRRLTPRPDCKAPPGTAAVEQYCESLPTADGDTHLGDKPPRPLAAVLPEPIVHRLQKAGVAGEVILALPAGPTRAHQSERQQAPFDPRVKALLPGPALSPKSVVDAAAKSGAEHIDQGFGWALVLTLVRARWPLGGRLPAHPVNVVVRHEAHPRPRRPRRSASRSVRIGAPGRGPGRKARLSRLLNILCQVESSSQKLPGNVVPDVCRVAPHASLRTW